ncbi:MAG: CvpA family protein [Eubacterium sp.]|nr:CvpA family protein [Eubacterium sp.]
MTIFNYTVNYIDVALAVIVIAAAVAGYLRGIISSIVRFIRAALGLSLCFYFSSYYTQPVYDNLVKPRLLETINEKIVVTGNLDEVLKNLNMYVSSLPGFIADAFKVKSLNVSSDDIATSILTNVFEPVALTAVRVAIFLGVFIVFFAATGIIILAVKRHNKKKEEERGHTSTLKKTDRFFGLILGLLKAAVILFAITSVFMYAVGADDTLVQKSDFWKEVSNSSLVNIINSINPFNAITEGLI